MLQPEQLTIAETATITPPSGNKRRLKQSDIRALLRKAHRNADGTYRVVASKSLEGTPVGGFRFYGIRSDDPNDVIPHEHRRELRAYGTFSAWVNHVDSKSINTLDTMIQQGDRKVIRHNLLDFGSTVGSAGVYPREAFEGSEYLVEGKKSLAGIPTFGLYLKDWRTVPLYRARSVGAFPSRERHLGPGGVEAALCELGVPVVASRRQVLGGAPPAGVHRRDAHGFAPCRPVRRPEV